MLQRLLKIRYSEWFRSCACCGAQRSPVTFFCEGCWAALELRQNRAQRVRQAGHPHPVYSLYTWSPSADGWVRPLIYGLKGGGVDAAFARLALALSLERRSLGRPRYPLVFTPAPAGTVRTTSDDHARAFAVALSLLWGAPMRDILERVDSGSNKSRGLMERRKLKLRMRDSYDDSGNENEACSRNGTKKFRSISGAEHGTCIFVDDVITSGSTATAAFEALGRPRNYEVWTLAARPKLASLIQL